jgi:hypothetical protein
MPIVASQAPFKDFAAQLRTLSPEHRVAIKQIAQQDPRYIWYSDVRFPRIIDQLELLREEGGRRDLDFEIRRLVDEALRLLEGDELALFVASPKHYIRFLSDLRVSVEQEGRVFPETYLWMQSRVGREDRRYVLFGNQPPTWELPRLAPGLQAALEQRLAELRSAGSAPLSPTTSQPAPASEG